MSVILVGGALANKPGNGGAAWTRMSWVRGLARLGHDVYFVEQIDPATCRDESGSVCPLEQSTNAAFFRDVAQQFGLTERSALLLSSGTASVGVTFGEMERIAGEADLLVNISGHLMLPTLKGRCRRRTFIDLDPGYTQFWHEQGLAHGALQNHHDYYTVGELIGTPACTIPTGGIDWRPIRQPVVLDDWPVTVTSAPRTFTTIASWRGPYGRVMHGGRQHGVKAHEFRKFVSLPAASPWPVEIAVDADPADGADMALLQNHRWRLRDSRVVAAQPSAFRQYIQQSAAEFSVAQGIYVDTNSGWFSDRTVRYLASGKPALVQDTGFSSQYPVGLGLIAFKTQEEAAAGAQAIARDYDAHSTAARALAEHFFDSDRVLGALLDDVL